MPLSLVEIEKEVSLLTLDQKERLLGFLIAALEPPDEGDIEAAWEEEVLARSKEIHEGRVKPVPVSEALARVRHSLL